MNTRSLGAYTRTSTTEIIEHTPIYDLEAFQRQRKKIQTRKLEQDKMQINRGVAWQKL